MVSFLLLPSCQLKQCQPVILFSPPDPHTDIKWNKSIPPPSGGKLPNSSISMPLEEPGRAITLLIPCKSDGKMLLQQGTTESHFSSAIQLQKVWTNDIWLHTDETIVKVPLLMQSCWTTSALLILPQRKKNLLSVWNWLVASCLRIHWQKQ